MQEYILLHAEHAEDYGSADAIAEIAYRSLCGKLAEALYPYMEFEMSDDYRTNSAIIRGRLRVMKPDYRF